MVKRRRRPAAAPFVPEDVLEDRKRGSVQHPYDHRRAGREGQNTHPGIVRSERPGVQQIDYPSSRCRLSTSPTSEKFVIVTSPSGNSATIFNLPPTASM